MGRVKVMINRDMPSAEVVRSYRNFGSIMQRYQMYYRTDGIRYMLYNQRKKLVYIVLIIIFLLLLLFADDIKAQNNIPAFIDTVANSERSIHSHKNLQW